MNWNDWYTDLMEIRRTETVKDGQLSRKERKVVRSGVPCRVYRSQDKPLTMILTCTMSPSGPCFPGWPTRRSSFSARSV